MASKDFSVKTTFTAIDNFTKTIQSIDSHMKKLQGTMDAFNKAFNATASTISKTADDMATAMGKVDNVVNGINRNIGTLKSVLDQYSNTVNTTNQATSTQAKATQAASNATKASSNATKAATGATQTATKATKEKGEAVKNTNMRLGRYVEGLGMVYTNLNLATAATAYAKTAVKEFVDAIKYAVNAAGAVETALIGVSNVTGRTGKELQQLKQIAIDVGESTQFSTKDMLEAQQNLGQMGLVSAETTSEQIRALTETTAYFAVATGQTIQQTTQTIGNLSASMGGDIKEMSDQFLYLTNTSQIAVKELQNFAKLGTLVKTANQSKESLMALTAAYREVAPTTRVATTHIQSFGNALMAVHRNSNKMAEMQTVAKAIGKTDIIYDANGQMREMVDIIQDLEKGYKAMGYTQEQVRTSMGTMFNSTAANVYFGVVAKGTEEIRKNTEKIVKESVGLVDRSAKQMADTYEGLMAQLKGVVENIYVEVGEELLPDIKDAIRDVINTLKEMDFSVMATSIMNLLKPVLDLVSSLVPMINDVILPTFQSLIDMLTPAIGLITRIIQDLKPVAEMVAKALQWVFGIVEGILKDLTTIYDGIKWIFTGLSGTMSDATKGLETFRNKTTESAQAVEVFMEAGMDKDFQFTKKLLRDSDELYAKIEAVTSVFPEMGNTMKQVAESQVMTAAEKVGLLNTLLDEMNERTQITTKEQQKAIKDATRMMEEPYKEYTKLSTQIIEQQRKLSTAEFFGNDKQAAEIRKNIARMESDQMLLINRVTQTAKDMIEAGVDPKLVAMKLDEVGKKFEGHMKHQVYWNNKGMDLVTGRTERWYSDHERLMEAVSQVTVNALNDTDAPIEDFTAALQYYAKATGQSYKDIAKEVANGNKEILRSALTMHAGYKKVMGGIEETIRVAAAGGKNAMIKDMAEMVKKSSAELDGLPKKTDELITMLTQFADQSGMKLSEILREFQNGNLSLMQEAVNNGNKQKRIVENMMRGMELAMITANNNMVKSTAASLEKMRHHFSLLPKSMDEMADMMAFYAEKTGHSLEYISREVTMGNTRMVGDMVSSFRVAFGSMRQTLKAAEDIARRTGIQIMKDGKYNTDAIIKIIEQGGGVVTETMRRTMDGITEAVRQKAPQTVAEVREMMRKCVAEVQRGSLGMQNHMRDAMQGMQMVAGDVMDTFVDTVDDGFDKVERTVDTSVDAIGNTVDLGGAAMADSWDNSMTSVYDSTARHMENARREMESQIQQMQSQLKQINGEITRLEDQKMHILDQAFAEFERMGKAYQEKLNEALRVEQQIADRRAEIQKEYEGIVADAEKNYMDSVKALDDYAEKWEANRLKSLEVMAKRIKEIEADIAAQMEKPFSIKKSSFNELFEGELSPKYFQDQLVSIFNTTEENIENQLKFLATAFPKDIKKVYELLNKEVDKEQQKLFGQYLTDEELYVFQDVNSRKKRIEQKYGSEAQAILDNLDFIEQQVKEKELTQLVSDVNIVDDSALKQAEKDQQAILDLVITQDETYIKMQESIRLYSEELRKVRSSEFITEMLRQDPTLISLTNKYQELNDELQGMATKMSDTAEALRKMTGLFDAEKVSGYIQVLDAFSNIDLNEQNLRTQGSSISTFLGNFPSDSSHISTLARDLGSIDDQLKNLAKKKEGLETNINYLKYMTELNDTAFSNTYTALRNMGTAMTTFSNDVTPAATAMSTIEGAFNTLTGNDPTIFDDFTTNLKASIKAATSDIAVDVFGDSGSGLIKAMGALTDAIKSLVDAVGKLSTYLGDPTNSLKTELEGITSSLTNVLSDIGTLTSNVTALSGNVTSTQANLTGVISNAFGLNMSGVTGMLGNLYENIAKLLDLIYPASVELRDPQNQPTFHGTVDWISTRVPGMASATAISNVSNRLGQRTSLRGGMGLASGGLVSDKINTANANPSYTPILQDKKLGYDNLVVRINPNEFVLREFATNKLLDTLGKSGLEHLNQTGTLPESYLQSIMPQNAIAFPQHKMIDEQKMRNTQAHIDNILKAQDKSMNNEYKQGIKKAVTGNSINNNTNNTTKTQQYNTQITIDNKSRKTEDVMLRNALGRILGRIA